MASPPNIIIIGSGIAGLFSALLIAEKYPVTILTKNKINNTNTRWAQGGIAAVWGTNDSIELHISDTLKAGNGRCTIDAVRLLVENSRASIEKLIQIGTKFDKEGDNSYKLGLEGAHSIPRILHAGGDATGLEIQRALKEKVLHHNNIVVKEFCQVIKLVNTSNTISSVQYLDLKNNIEVNTPADIVVLSSGGAGDLFQYTSNPQGSIGEGIFLAYEAGATLSDLEFIQFHPTALNLPNVPNFLISEALRGEGAILRNEDGIAFMEGVHPLKDLAPRDVVARCIFEQISNNKKVFLDATALGSTFLQNRFPTIYTTCLQYSISIDRDLIPITPVAHYTIGGVNSDLNGKTNLENLYVCGEIAKTGVHGSNRLASNSLLEGAVYGMRCADSIFSHGDVNFDRQSDSEEKVISLSSDKNIDEQYSSLKKKMQILMWENSGILRTKISLENSLKKLEEIIIDNFFNKAQEFELQGMRQISILITKAALKREESIGVHQRLDFPKEASSYIQSIQHIKKRIT